MRKGWWPKTYSSRTARPNCSKTTTGDGGDSYYRAVLQNLFFATLNTEIDHRGFSNENNNTHRDFSRYRYRNEMSEPGRPAGLVQQDTLHKTAACSTASTALTLPTRAATALTVSPMSITTS